MLSSEENVIYRASLGQLAQLGDLYDARTDNFVGMSLLRQTPPVSSVVTVPTFNQRAEVFVGENSVERTQTLDISAELQLGICTELIKLDLSGSAGYARRTHVSRKALQAVLMCDVRTEQQKLNMQNADLRPCIAIDLLRNSRATHVVTEIHWGAKALLTITDENVTESDKLAIQSKLESKLREVAVKLAKNERISDVNVVDSSFSIQMYSDIQLNQMPTTFAQAIALMYDLPSGISRTNNGKGRPMKYGLFRLCQEEFRADLGLPVPAPFNPIQSIDDDLAAAFVRLFDDVSQLKFQVNEDKDYVRRCYRTSPMLKDLQTVEDLLIGLETALRKNLGQKMKSVRSGEASNDVLREYLDVVTTKLADISNKLDAIEGEPAHSYIVTVFTGNRSCAGTDADVSIQLSGKYVESADIPLIPNNKKNCFERDQIDSFNIKFPLLLRPVKLRVQHNNTGTLPGWFLNKIDVTDPRSQEIYEFPCYKWLADEVGGCQLEYCLLGCPPVAKANGVGSASCSTM